MTSKLIVNNIEADAGVSTITFGSEISASKITTSSTSAFSSGLNVTGVSTFTSDVSIADKIIHTGDTNTAIRFPADDTITAETGGSERARIDSSGRLLIGTNGTHGFYSSGLQVAGSNLAGTQLICRTDNNQYGANLYLAKTRGTSIGSKTIVQSGDIVGQVIYSGTDGVGDISAAIISGEVDGTPGASNMPGRLVFSTNGGAGSPTERMRIDSSGNLSLGNASSPANNNLHFDIYTNSSYDGFIRFRDQNGAPGLIEYDHGSDSMALYTNATERARIDSAGRVSINTSSPNTDLKLSVNGAIGANDYVSHFSNKSLQVKFYNADNNSKYIGFAAEDSATAVNGDTFKVFRQGSAVERMRITNAGYTKITNTGTYNNASGNYHEARNGNGDWCMYLTNTHGSFPNGLVVRYSESAPNDTAKEFLYCFDTGATRFTVRSNGGIANYSGNNVNLCDEREKKNIESLDSTWSCLKNWELKKFHYNEDADTDDKRYGVIAQQVAPHCPEVITDWIKQRAEDAVLDDDGNVVTPAREEVTRMGVKEQQMMWMAIKALQEAQTRIETLEAKVAALENP